MSGRESRAWQRLSAVGWGPAGVYSARIVLVATGGSGSAWFDNVNLTK